MSTKVVLVHGYNAGPDSWQFLVPALQQLGVVCIVWQYPRFLGSRWNGLLSGLVGARCLNPARGRALARVLRNMSINNVIAHSNGCVVADHAGREKEIGTFIALHPALDVTHEFSSGIRRVVVFHDEGDLPVRWASWLIGHKWGAMGAFGASMDLWPFGRVINRAYDKDIESGIAEHTEALGREWADRLAAEIVPMLCPE